MAALAAGVLPGVAASRPAGAATAAPAKEPKEHRARLILLITVDQLGARELDHLRPFVTGGLRLLLDRGVSFAAAHHAHAVTETGPGHATLSTARFPRHHGIVSNWWLAPGDPKKRWCVDDDEYEESPRQLLVSSLGDWLKQHSPSSKIIAAGGKDRSAILLGGKGADAAFWYDDETGRFETSDYYDEPDWLAAFNDRRLLDAHYGEAWEPLPLPTEALQRLHIEALDLGPLRTGFPHVLGAPRPAPAEDFYEDVWDSPLLDRYLLQLARQIIESEDLGADDSPDLLALSFSAADAVGHDYGPDSREYVDVLLRLDAVLEELLELVDRRVGLDRVIVGLSSDHGVVPLPEIRQRRGLPGRRVDAEMILCLQQVGRRLADSHGVDRWLVSGPFLANELSERTGKSRATLEDETAHSMEQCPGVARVWTRSDLLQPVAEAESEQWLFANSYHPERSPDFLIRFDEYLMTSVDLATTHGTTYLYDRRVPLIVLATRLMPASIDIPVRTVDLAPTLAALAGIPFPPEVDGHDLTPLIAPRRAD